MLVTSSFDKIIADLPWPHPVPPALLFKELRQPGSTVLSKLLVLPLRDPRETPDFINRDPEEVIASGDYNNLVLKIVPQFRQAQYGEGLRDERPLGLRWLAQAEKGRSKLNYDSYQGRGLLRLSLSNQRYFDVVDAVRRDVQVTDESIQELAHMWHKGEGAGVRQFMQSEGAAIYRGLRLYRDPNMEERVISHRDIFG